MYINTAKHHHHPLASFLFNPSNSAAKAARIIVKAIFKTYGGQ